LDGSLGGLLGGNRLRLVHCDRAFLLVALH
jgi:hypothetical protein